MFPIVVRVGQTRATIYHTPSHGCDAFTVSWYEGPVRKRKAFADLEGAKLHASAAVNSLSRGEAEAVRLSGEERLCYLRAREAVSEFGVSLDGAAIEYRDAKRLLRGGSLVEAARQYAEHRLLNVPRKSVQEVFAELLAAKRDEGLSRRYLEDLTSRLGRFTHDFQCPITNVSGGQLKAWLQGLKVANRTRNNFRLALQTLFSFAKARRYLPREWSEFEAVPVWKTTAGPVEIFPPDEMARLLRAAPENMIPFLTLGAFAGLRTAEIERLDWSKVNLKTGYITVDAGIAKTNSRRLVPVAANLKAWLSPLVRPHGPVVELANLANAIQRLVQATGSDGRDGSAKGGVPAVVWRHNALRHSFCSYRLAEIKNAAQVALEAGNSPQMIFKHYRELVTEAEARQWFGIMPALAENVAVLPQAAAA